MLQIKFGTYYLHGQLVVYDVCLEERHGRRYYVASLSEDPRISFAAVRPEHAVEQLKAHLAHQARAHVTWLPADHQAQAAV